LAIVQKYGDRPSEPSGGKDKVNGVVSIDIARLYLQAACRSNKLDGLLPDCGEVKLNPVVGTTNDV
jgi:hypothetical protein